MTVTLCFWALDGGLAGEREFPTLDDARVFAHYWVGEGPALARVFLSPRSEPETSLAMRAIGRLDSKPTALAIVSGCTLGELFPYLGDALFDLSG